jgi:hypothetical protein
VILTRFELGNDVRVAFWVTVLTEFELCLEPFHVQTNTYNPAQFGVEQAFRKPSHGVASVWLIIIGKPLYDCVEFIALGENFGRSVGMNHLVVPRGNVFVVVPPRRHVAVRSVEDSQRRFSCLKELPVRIPTRHVPVQYPRSVWHYNQRKRDMRCKRLTICIAGDERCEIMCANKLIYHALVSDAEVVRCVHGGWVLGVWFIGSLVN